jgi:hypothetical protein
MDIKGNELDEIHLRSSALLPISGQHSCGAPPIPACFGLLALGQQFCKELTVCVLP